jgi:hypothetical protein
VGTSGVTTYNPSTMEITNRWPYPDFIAALPTPTNNQVCFPFSSQERNAHPT